MCIRLIFCRRVSSYLQSESKFYRYGQIEENPSETLVERYGRHFEGVAGVNRIRLLRYAVSDQARNVSSGCGDRKQDGMTRDSRLTTRNLTPVQVYKYLLCL